MLSAYNLSKSFGSLEVTRDVSLHLGEGARHALIGPNGAGKTTIFNILSGEIFADSGSIMLEGKNITTHPSHKRARAGIARSFQVNSLFPDFSVLRNIMLALVTCRGLVANLWRKLDNDKMLRDDAISIAELVGLGDVLETPARDLPYGSQRQLEVGLVLALSPKVLLLDEPTAGMSPAETKRMLSIIGSLPMSLAILIVEHDMDVVFQVSHWMTVLDDGAVLFEGTPDDVRKSEVVRSTYLRDF
jgi:branched-chain amino acid transport system ATP-binding protein